MCSALNGQNSLRLKEKMSIKCQRKFSGRDIIFSLCTKEQLEANYLTRIVNDIAPKAGLGNGNEKLLPKRWQRGAN